jgi:RNA polymerase sigma-70 factor, ECF subfamily
MSENLLAQEQSLVAACLAGDPAALREFVNQFYNMIYAVAHRTLQNHHDAEDVSQESILRAIRNLHQWDGLRPLKPWLLTITMNRCRTRLGKKSKQAAHELSIEPASTDTNPNRAALAEELEIALVSLRDDYRQAFALFYEQELPLAEVAEVMGVPEGTVKTWLHRARKELSSRLAERGVTP